MSVLLVVPPMQMPSNMNLTGSWPIDLAVWAFCFAYVLGMLAFLAYCVKQIATGRGHRG